jgi:hypothetical protein
MVQLLLQALAAVTAALKNSPGLTGEVANFVNAADEAAQNALTAHAAAQVTENPASLTPETPVS